MTDLDIDEIEKLAEETRGDGAAMFVAGGGGRDGVGSQVRFAEDEPFGGVHELLAAMFILVGDEVGVHPAQVADAALQVAVANLNAPRTAEREDL